MAQEHLTALTHSPLEFATVQASEDAHEQLGERESVDVDLAVFTYDALPPPNAGCVQCLLHHIPFDHDTPEYETLSYCWGTSSDVRTISCNRQRLRVTQTLHRAMHALLTPGKSRLVWIDQLCINQHDDAEKTQQVSIMRDIYQRSSLTIAWLGSADYHTNAALKAAHRIAMAMTSDTVVKTLKETHGGPWSAHSMDTFVEYRDGWGDAKPSRSEWTALSVLLGRPWFARMWVLQEVGVSGRVVVRCGEAQVDFDELMWAVSIAMLATAGRKRQVALGRGNVKQLMFLSSLRQAEPSDASLGLLRLIEAAQSFGATDPRDKFFALYGLTITNLPALGLGADYSLPADWVYMQTVSTLMKESDSLQLLELVNKPSKRSPLLPSWVPSLEPSTRTVDSLSGSTWSDVFTIGRRMQRRLIVITLESRFPNWHTLEEDKREEAIEQALDELGADREAESQVPLLAVSKASKLSTFNLEESGALRLSAQLFDKVNQTSRALKVPLFIGAEYHTLMDEADTVKGTLQAYGGLFKNLYRDVREYAQALTERDEMVMARESTSYPTGEPLLTAYRKALSAGSLLLNEQDATEVFTEWRKLFKPARLMSKLGSSIGASGGMAVMNLIVGGQTVSRNSDVFFAMIEVAWGRRLSWTENGYLALLPEEADEGDLIVILRGGRLPFVVRPVAHGFRLIGPAYVHGIMNGEAYDEESCGDIRLV
ncbi:hypothetical protein LTR12_001921 [Friedmanniomyces endolithicus]|uniref:Heterokaryon incompatibility domain-containing protein n=1 Tax=Friedmanniomyces endolithicus TaxID=329885 RepID=A0A4U0UVL9_9PEZI|nr:hypothetical protein LTS09_010283 [Friedmanniomyces endolithicus]KAK1823735.1 hypothetical protein LTR12_001921 [Friedmanniomyces endolithicus]TKA39185.1 hypothetical protein B0A54_08494 [Friedmanniomyces endolithicus]